MRKEVRRLVGIRRPDGLVAVKFQMCRCLQMSKIDSRPIMLHCKDDESKM